MTQIVRGEDKEGTLGAVSRCVVLQMMSPELYSPDTRDHCDRVTSRWNSDPLTNKLRRACTLIH